MLHDLTATAGEEMEQRKLATTLPWWKFVMRFQILFFSPPIGEGIAPKGSNDTSCGNLGQLKVNYELDELSGFG